jgi:DNA-binding CsgD family transcriptional regulator
MKSKSMPIQYKVDINPSYEWAEEAQALNVSHRELEVLALVTEGYSNKEIAQILKIKHQSVKNHMHSLYKKLGVRNKAQALIIALHLNLMKARGKTQYKDVPVFEITADKFIDGFRKAISGEVKYDGVSEETIRFLRVFLKEHGIDPDNW